MKEYMDNSRVQINGETYVFSNRIGRDEKVFNSFNSLAQRTFGISFNAARGEYEPHVLKQGEKVCANISVNKIIFYHRGERKLYIQLGTVMTDKEYRKRGLSRWLMEHILEKWKGRCDAIYLFANDSVLNFYPKFGFLKYDEYDFTMNVKKRETEKAPLRKLDMEKADDIRLAYLKYAKGNPYSSMYMAENRFIFSFYAEGIMRSCVYYAEKYDLLIIMSWNKDKDTLYCYDMFGTLKYPLKDVLKGIAGELADSVILGFTPKDSKDFILKKHVEDDTTLFVHESSECIFGKEKLMFPVISHA